MVKQAAPHRALSRSFKNSSQAELSSSLTPWTSPSPPTVGPDSYTLPEWNPSCIPDRVYLNAAAIFLKAYQDKPISQQHINYGKRSKVTVLKLKDEDWQRRAYELALNTLKYLELLEDIMMDSSFYSSKPVTDNLMSLVAVMLYDLQDRKFLPREPLANQDKTEEVAEVRKVENSLLRFKTKLAASLARCRIKHDLPSIDLMLPESVRLKQERGSNMPIYAWINTLHTSMQDVCEVLKSAGFFHVNSITELDGLTFCKDLHCLDLLVFPSCAKRELHRTNLLKECRLVIQDKSCCVGPWALHPFLVPDADIIMAGSFSAATVAHTAAIITAAQTHTHPYPCSRKPPRTGMRVFVCVGEYSRIQRDELQEVICSMGCSNVKLLPEALHSLDVCDTRLQKVQLILLTPQCSLSAVSNPLDYLLWENRGIEQLQDLTQGSVSQTRLQTLVSKQKRDLQHALHFPEVRVVVYSTCSLLPEENEEVVESVLALSEQDNMPLPYMLSHPSLLGCDKKDGSEGKQTDFFRLEASDKSNGCFLAVLTCQPKPEVSEAPCDLLDGILPSQPIKKEGCGRKTRKGPVYQSLRRPHISISSQSRVVEFRNRKMKASVSAPVKAQERTSSTHPPSASGKSKPTQHFCKRASSNTSSSTFTTGPTSSPSLSSSTFSCSTGLSLSFTTTASFITGPASSSTPFNTTHVTKVSDSSIRGVPVIPLTKCSGTSSYRTLNRASGHRAAGPVALPLAPPRSRQEVLRPVLITFPPPQFPVLCPTSGQVKTKTRLLHQDWRNQSHRAPLIYPRFGGSMRP